MEIAEPVADAVRFLSTNEVCLNTWELAEKAGFPRTIAIEIIGRLWCQRLIRPTKDQKWTNIGLQHTSPV